MIACNSSLRAMTLEYDVIIIGAGPAGSTAARFCAKEGLKTLLIDKERFPRYKPCGGFISPRVLRQFDFDIEGIIENTVSEAGLYRVEIQQKPGILLRSHLVWKGRLR
jgi:flavin-dependent dehydrogenase